MLKPIWQALDLAAGLFPFSLHSFSLTKSSLGKFIFPVSFIIVDNILTKNEMATTSAWPVQDGHAMK